MATPKKQTSCKHCSTPMDRFGKYCTACKAIKEETRRKNFSKWVSSSKAKNKQKAVEYKGGKCQICGYDKCVKALVFHHVDPSIKDFGIANVSKSFENIKTELDKCVLLCSNCHIEVHEYLHSGYLVGAVGNDPTNSTV